jgi:class 3 adenylate cyclase/predicted ATPase
VPAEALLAQLYPQQVAPVERLTNAVTQARKALGESSQAPRYIETVRRRGYRFIAPVTVERPPEPDRQHPPAPAPPLPPDHAAAGAAPVPLSPAPLSVAAPAQDVACGQGTNGQARPDAERRQLTALFCDLVGSTALAGQLDPEDLREVMRAYLETCTAVIARFGGTIDKFLGDGALVCFGYPQAHEDAPQRAVRAGVGIVEAVGRLNPQLEQTWGVQLAVRLGIHTGLVVAGALGVAGTRDAQTIVGEVPTLAARLQEVGVPNTVVCSAATARLVDGYFTLEALGPQRLQGVATPVSVYRVVGESTAQTRFDLALTRGLTPLVGREPEVALLRERWAAVQDGRGQVVMLSGEAGIGKSRLAQAFTAHLRGEGYLRIACHCSPYAQHSALYPVIAQLHRLLRLRPAGTPAEHLRKLEATLRTADLALQETVPLLAALLALPLPARYAPLPLTPQRQKQLTLATLLAWVLQEAARQPVCVVLEDLQWVDPSTLELLSLLIAQLPPARVLLLLLFRPEFRPPWPMHSHCTHLVLGRLSTGQTAEMVRQVMGDTMLPEEVVQQVIATTDGVPLFIEELTKMVVESALVTAREGRYALTGPLAIPVTLHDSLMARLDRLGPVKQIAQWGAVVGREFPYTVLHAVAPVDEAQLTQGLAQLVEAELLYQRGVPPQACYTFKHVLIQEVAYQSLLKSTRRQYHQQIAQVWETRFPHLAETQPELVAQHYTAAGCTEPAVVYWQRAGQLASDRSAHLEAVSHFTTGIALLRTLPETPAYTQHALALYSALGAALQKTKGHSAPEVEHAYTQAYALCQQVGEPPALAPVLYGLWRYYGALPQLHRAREIGDTLLRLAHRTRDAALAVVAHHAIGVMWLYLGVLPAARQHLEEGSARYTPDQRRAPVFHIGQDPGVACRTFAAQTLWLLGYPAQALIGLHKALALAHELLHPFSLAFAWCRAAHAYQLRRDVPAVAEHAEAAVTLATEQGFTQWVALGTSLRGWALALQGQGEAGLALVRQGIAAWQATGAVIAVPFLYTLLAEVCDHLGYTADGLQALDKAHALVEQHEERWWEAEVCRLRGVLLLRQTLPQPEEAETWLRRALDVARRQETKSLELRVTMSLSRLWDQQGKQADARVLLASVYSWFTEGFDTADLQEAKTWLEVLAGRSPHRGG